MKQCGLFIFLLLMVKLLPAQSKTTAMATATIIQAVGAEELAQVPSNHAPDFTAVPALAGLHNMAVIRQVDFTAFRIMGNAAVYSLSIQPVAVKPVMQQPGNKRLLGGITLKRSFEEPETFVLTSLIDAKEAQKGKYTAQNLLDVTVHFN